MLFNKVITGKPCEDILCVGVISLMLRQPTEGLKRFQIKLRLKNLYEVRVNRKL